MLLSTFLYLLELIHFKVGGKCNGIFGIKQREFSEQQSKGSVDLLSSKTKHQLVKLKKKSFKGSENCPEVIQQTKKHLFKKIQISIRTMGACDV